MSRNIPQQTVEWIVHQARAGQPPEVLLKPLIDDGGEEQDAIEAVEHAVRDLLDVHAREIGLPPSVPVPSPIELNRASRSEEHTSELESLMSISYAACCLNKKNN